MRNIELTLTSEAAVLCAITVTGVAIWKEERVKPQLALSFILTHKHSFLPVSLLSFTLPVSHSSIQAAVLVLEVRFIALNQDTPGSG